MAKTTGGCAGASTRRPRRALAIRHDDAVAHLRKGHPELAVPQLEQILIGCRTVFGMRHGPTLTVEGNLAVAYLCAERLDEGHALLVEVYKTRQRVLGPHDLATLTAGDCLATAHRLLGRNAEAVALGKRVVAARTAGAGPRARRHAHLADGPRARLPRRGRRARGPRAAGGAR